MPSLERVKEKRRSDAVAWRRMESVGSRRCAGTTRATRLPGLHALRPCAELDRWALVGAESRPISFSFSLYIQQVGAEQ